MRTLRVCILLISFVLSWPAVAAEKGLPVSALAKWKIAVADEASEPEKYAARELQSFLKQLGLSLPIVGAPPDSSGHILIGPDLAGSAPSDLGPDGLYIRITRDGIRIAGHRPRGTLYGVYTFLERYLGVRFLTFDHTHLPKPAADAALPIETHQHRPRLTFRSSYYGENRIHPEFAARMRNTQFTPQAHLGGNSRQRLINHSFARQIPTKTYGKEHPEYFALRDGKRLNNVPNDSYGTEPCLTNPDVLDIVTEAVLKEIAANPDAINYNVSQNDNDKYCQCEKCRAIDEREGTPMGTLLTFVNAVAKRVEAKYPHATIGTLSYWYTRKPPKTIKPRHNVQIQLCSIECCTLHPINDPKCEKNVAFCRDLADWSKLTDEIYIWNYNVNFRHYDLPHPNLRVLEPNIRYFFENNARGIFMQAAGNGVGAEMSDLRNYMLSNLLWDPTRSGMKLRDEFLDLHYGKAAEPIRAYLELIHDNAEAKGCHPTCFPGPEDVGLDPDIAVQAVRLFEKACRLADDEAVLARVEKASIPAYKAMLEAGVTWNVVGEKLLPVFPDGFEEAARIYRQRTTKYGMDRAAETVGRDAYLARVEEALLGLRAVTLENDIWRLVLLPERNGQIITMLHKPSKTNFVEGMAGHGLTVSHARSVDEIAMAGYGHDNPEAFEATRSGNRLTLNKTLAHGARLQRRIALQPDEPGKIFIETTFTHVGNPGHKYQFGLRCDLMRPSGSEADPKLDAYVLAEEWKQARPGWRADESINAELLADPAVSAAAVYYSDRSVGLVVRFNAEKTERVRLPKGSPFHSIDLGVVGQPFRLNPDEAFNYAYTIEFIGKPPGN